MNLEWILNPAAQYGAMALILVAVLCLVLSMKRELHLAMEQNKEARESANRRIDELAKEVEDLGLELKQIEANSIPPVPGESIDLTKRSRVLRMFHRGEQVPTIAAVLKAPQNEIELLLKVAGLMN